VSDDQLAVARSRLERLLAERDQVRGRARAATNPTARATYACRMLELVGDANAAIEAFNGLVGGDGQHLVPLELGAELAALAPTAAP
jgi:hypothetical protein